MGFLSNVLSSAVKVALSPITILQDSANIIDGEKPDATENLLKDASKDLGQAFNDLGDGEIL